MTEGIKSIVERIRVGIEKDGEFKLLLIDQMAFVKEGLDILEVFDKESWCAESGTFDSLIIRNWTRNSE